MAYNADVQAYIQYARLSKIRKDTILASKKVTIYKAGLCFSKLFPAKQRLILDEIVYFLAGKVFGKLEQIN
ncbi:hypothetical protein ACTXGU_19730 [Niallia sp. 01092]